MNLVFRDCKTIYDIPDNKFFLLNVSISIVPLASALFYPKIGTIISIVASISGFFMIYLVPVFCYMKMKLLEIKHPLLAVALQENEVAFVVPGRNSFSGSKGKEIELEFSENEGSTDGFDRQFQSSPLLKNNNSGNNEM
jgi:hypothetical protein